MGTRTPKMSRVVAPLSVALVVLLFPDIGESQTSSLQGFGALTLGGAGGTVVRVTTLADSGSGSLRDALSTGNRTVLFDVAGEISLTSPLYVLGAGITIDGTSAPAPGITLKGHGLIIRGDKGAHDVIVRGIRVRNSAIDGIQVASGAYSVVIDHVSVTGSQDGNIDITEGSHDVTVSWSLIGANGKNMLVKYNASRVTLHHNVFVASTTRSPQVRVDDGTTAVATEVTADIRNNVVADWGSGYGMIIWYGPWANVVNNFFAGVDDALTVTAARAYVAGNVAVGLDLVQPVELDVQGTEGSPFPAPAVDAEEACIAATRVLSGAGVRPLDATDDLLVSTIAAPSCGSGPPLLTADPPSLSFSAVEGGPSPPTQTVTIVDGQQGAVEWTATASTSDGATWLVASPTAGTTPWYLSVTARPAGLGPGIYSGTVTVEASAGSILSIPVVLVVAPPPQDVQTVLLVIADRDDDAREARTGVVKSKEKSLPLGDGNLIALRFAGVTIPQGAAIRSAVLQLVATNKSTLSVPLQIRYVGEASDDSAPVTTARGGLATRAKTAAFVDDAPGAWGLNQLNASPDLAAIVQGIVARPRCRLATAVTVFIEDTGSRGKRIAGSLDDRASRAALLTITYWPP